jgi:glutathione S-transferase
MTFTLINARPSPFGRKVAIAMIEKGIDYQVRYDVPWGDGTCTPDFSPLEQLPILIAPDGEQIYDSVYILEWLEARFPKPSLIPQDANARLDVKKRQMLGERLMEVAQSLIFELHRPDASPSWVDRQTRKIPSTLAELDRMYVMRTPRDQDPIDLGDIAVATTLLIFEFVVPAGLSQNIDALLWRGRYPGLTRFVESVEERPSFAATVPQPMEVDLQATVR